MKICLLVIGLLGSVTTTSPFPNFLGPQASPFPVNPFQTYRPFGQPPFLPAAPLQASQPVPQAAPFNPAISAPIKAPAKREVFDIMFQWKILDYKFDSPAQRKQYLDSGEFVPENNLPLGIDRWRDRLFITTPRWRLGAPASLSSIPLTSNLENPPLEPYPNIEFHSTVKNPDCSKLVSVYRTYVDECDRLWVIDAGVVETLTNFRQVCPPKIVIFDLLNNFPIFSYEIPPDQVKQDSLHSSIIVDISQGKCENAFAYVTDVWRFGIVVFSFAEGRSWRTVSHLHLPNPLAASFTFNGIDFQWTDGTFGLSLAPPDPKGDRIMFFHPMASYDEFMVNTRVLKNESAWTGTALFPSAESFTPVGTRGKRGQSSTVSISRGGVQVFNMVQRASIGCWDIRKPYTINNVGIVEADGVKINFPNDLKIDRAEPQHIWVLTNNLPTFLYATLDYNQINFRVLTTTVDKAVAGTVCDPKAPASNVLETADTCNL